MSFFLNKYLKEFFANAEFYLHFRREKQEGTENEEDDATKNGFVPIGQAIKNAEVRSAAATTVVNGET